MLFLLVNYYQMTPDIRKKINHLVAYLETNRGMLVIDADTHASNTDNLHPSLREPFESITDYYHGKPVSAEDLIREMEMASVDMSLIWQNPAATWYGEDEDENYASLLAANRYIFDVQTRYPETFIGAGWTDPGVLGIDKALKMVDTCIQEFGFLIVKLNPAPGRYPIDSERVCTLVDRVFELGGVPAFHYGADTPYTPAEGLLSLAERYPDQPIMAVNMGGGGAGYPEAEQHYRRSREIGLRYPNIRFVMIARRDTHTESDLITYQMAGEPFSRNLFCASDAPFGRMTWNFGGYRWMILSLMDHEHHTDERVRQTPGLFTEEDMRNYLGANFAEFLIDGYKKLLKTQQ